MKGKEEFYTLKGYKLHEDECFTDSMEDYLEMICRIAKNEGEVRVNQISKLLHVKPSSVSKKVQQLNDLGYISAQKYGVISVTEKGKVQGDYLLYRHNVVHKFLCALNNSNDELEQTEKIEHFLNKTTIINLDNITKKITPPIS